MSEKKLYLHITNLAPESRDSTAEITLGLEAGRKILIGRYTPDKTAFVATEALRTEGIVNPPDPPGRKTEVKKVGLDINSVSRSHGTFSRQGEAVYYQDHSRFGTEYHDHAGDGRGPTTRNLSNAAVKVNPGDILYFGKHTPEVPFKYSIVVTRRKTPRRPKG
jgi:hypothetical protein